jgi:type IX secretion system PorP/SprF family membrane protein
MNSIMKKESMIRKIRRTIQGSFILMLSMTSSTFTKAQQDIHFSQFYTSPLMINPGACGMMNGDIRLMSNFRNQWGGLGNPFQTISASVDAPLLREALNENFLGIGATFYNDKAGDSRLTTGNYMFNVSYAIQMADEQFIGMGIQLGFLQRSISYSGLYWGNQFTGTTFDQSLPNGEGAPISSMDFDINAGIYYNGKISDKTLLFGGIAGSHLTSPDLNFNGSLDKLFMKITAHGGAQIAIPNSKVKICPNFLTKFQGPNRIINIGTDFKILLKEASRSTVFFEETSLDFGTYLRIGDAFYAALRLNWGPLSIGAAYDITVSGLTTYKAGNAMEFMLSYTTPFSKTGGRTSRFL